MREIKFRAWDKEDGMLDISHWTVNMLNENRLPSFQIMQFTGLHDKNGKEIWEGDIIFDDGGIIEGIRYMGIVTYGEWNGAPMFYSNTSIFGTPERLMLTKTTQVLGNIYENQELLKP